MFNSPKLISPVTDAVYTTAHGIIIDNNSNNCVAANDTSFVILKSNILSNRSGNDAAVAPNDV